MNDTDLDVAFNTDSGYFDLSINPQTGDLTMTQGLDTALLCSLMLDKRLTSTEVPQNNLRGGWVGNLYTEMEMGSKLHALSGPMTDTIANESITYCRSALQWLIDKNYIDSMTTSSSYINDTLTISITLYKDGDILTTATLNVFTNTLLILPETYLS